MNRKSKKRVSPETTSLTNDATNELQEQIRRRAYELYEQRGRVGGRELDDWLQAQAELTQLMARAKAA